MPFRKLEAPEALDDLGWLQQAGSGRFVANWDLSLIFALETI
jgi:hypothetical protein